MSVERWKYALMQLAGRNRVHVGSDTSAAYRDLAEFYDNSEIIGFPSGETSGYWSVPNAWEVDGATLTAPDGSVVADWRENKLSLFTYSPAFKGKVSLEQLEDRLFSIPDKPNRTPFHFRNQYRHWDIDWGFCLPDSVRRSLKPGTYEVDIATRFVPGEMEMLEQVHQGQVDDSLLLVGHFDHPAMCNDGLVGCLAGHEVVSRLSGRETRLTYRMLSTIEIIGSVFYAAEHAPAKSVRQALFMATAGARAPLNYQTSFSGTAPIDRVMTHVFRHYAAKSESENIHGFRQGPLCNDETAFDVGGVNIPCGVVMRAPFDEYHTDADNLDAVAEENFEEQVDLVLKAIDILERNAKLTRRFSGLPCLSNPELDLYLSPSMVSQVRTEGREDRAFAECNGKALAAIEKKPDALNHLTNVLPIMCEGDLTTLDVAEKVDLPFELVDVYTERWSDKGLLEKEWINPLASA